jgi:hypothetical protein
MDLSRTCTNPRLYRIFIMDSVHTPAGIVVGSVSESTGSNPSLLQGAQVDRAGPRVCTKRASRDRLVLSFVKDC